MLTTTELFIEAILFTAGEPVSIERLQQLLEDQEKISAQDLRRILQTLQEYYHHRSMELVEVAGGFRLQTKPEYAPLLQKMHARKTVRYSRAFLETLALIAYRQPITRGEIEEVRGVAVSSHIIKTLLELEWIRVVGQRDIPGKPSLYGTTKKFLADFNLKALSELPTLQKPRDLDQLEQQLTKQLSILPACVEE